MAALAAPVAVRVLDLEAPLDDLVLSREHSRQPYRSLLAVVRLANEPIGIATFRVDPNGCVTRAQLTGGLDRQLEAEIDEAYARRGFEREPDSSSDLTDAADRLGIAPSPSVSVVVPTCSNPEALERCLRSILLCEYDDFEVIVVENRPGASDTARMLVRQFADEPRLRYVEEPRPSASRARTAGLASAEGEIVAFTDDDVVVDPLWLRASVEALLSAPSIACVTGLILPLELESESQLLLEQFAGFGKGFRRTTYHLPESLKENPLLPYSAGALGSGASIVMLTEVARELGGFDPALGPATPATGGEDLDLLVRVLRNGHAVSYEPRAIVWHEHPGGSSRLSRQVYRYGVGLGAMLAKQLIAGPQRRDFLRAIPAGLRYLRDPGSRKNVGKPTEYPRHLTWLERLGMLVGPVAYLMSALMVRVRRVPQTQAPRPRPVRIMRRIAVGGEGVNVVSFREVEAPQVRFAWRRVAERDAVGPSDQLVLGTAVICAAASVLVALGAPVAARVPAVLALLCVAPGIAFLTAVRGRAEAGLVIGISMGLSGVIAQSMLWFSVWRPHPFTYGVAGACLLPLAWRLATTRGRVLSDGTAILRRGRARLAGFTITSNTAMHTALVVVALAGWATSLAGAHLGRIDGVGLLAALPPTYFVAFALLLVGFAVAVTSEEPDSRLLGAYVLAVIVVIHGTTAVLYAEPRYAWTYPHLGVINLIAAAGSTNRQIDIYNNWPSFFALSAWFSKASGLAPIAYAGWAQLFFNLFNVAAVRFALRALTRDERLLWTAALFFVLGNWVGQDYLAPQAYAFALSLVVVGLCLQCGRVALRPRRRPRRWPAEWLQRLAAALLPPRAPDEDLPAPPLGPRAALFAGGVCFVAVLTSHQLSPVLLILSVLALAVFARRVPIWIPVVMIGFEVWWVALAWPFVVSHFPLLDPGTSAGAGASGRNLAAAPPGARLTFYAPAAVMMLLGVLALIGFTRRLRAGKRDLTAMCLIAAPVLGVGVQSYGGEGPFRGYLFALPWLAFFAAFACVRAVPPVSRTRVSMGRLTIATIAVSVCLLFAYFGEELANRISPDDVAAARWYELHAPPGSIRIDLAPNNPDRLTSRYPLVSLGDPSALLDTPGFSGHRLGAADVPRLERLIQQQRDHPTYVVLTASQEDYGRLNGLIPKGSLLGLRRALASSGAFRLVYRRPSAWIFQYAPPTGS